MAQKTLATRIILRNDTSANWTAIDPTLLKGEIGLETDTGRYKIGNGVDSWSLTPYFVNLGVSDKSSLDTLITMLNDDDFGKVDDVKVNNTSVVTDKVANISIGTLTVSEDAQTFVPDESFSGSIVLHKVAKTGNYNDLLDKLNVVDGLDSVSATDVLSANQGNVLKKMVQALPSARSYLDIQSLVSALNSYNNTEMNVGTNLYIQQIGVPDFWVYSTETTSVSYGFTSDSAFVSEVQTNGSVQIGYYRVSLLETAKVDLSNYYTKTQVDELIANIDLSNFYNKTEVDEKLANKLTKNTTYASYISRFVTATLGSGDEQGTGATFYTVDSETGADLFNVAMYFKNSDFNTDLTSGNVYVKLGDSVIKTTDTLIIDGGSSEV